MTYVVYNNETLPNCGIAEGLNERNSIEEDIKDYESTLEKYRPYLKDQHIFIFGGDSVSRQIQHALWKVVRFDEAVDGKLIEDLIDADVYKGIREQPVKQWTVQTYCTAAKLNFTYYFSPHGSPMLGNDNSHIGKSTADKIKNIRKIMTGDGSNYHFFIGQGYHFSSGNPAVLIKEYFDCNTEAKNLLKDFPKANFYFKELHPLKLEKDHGLHTYFFGNWNFYRHNLIAERVLDAFWEKVYTWNYIFTRYDTMETHNPHPKDTEIAYILKSFISKVVSKVQAKNSENI